MTKKNFALAGMLLCVVAVISVFQNCQPLTAQNFAVNSESEVPGGGTTPPPGGSVTIPVNEQYFISTIRPVFQAQCITCHAEPRFVQGTAGSLAIYNYAPMRALLAAGTPSAVANNLVRKVTGAESHIGGNSCALGVVATDPVCGKIMQWYQREFPTSVAGLYGQVTSVSFNGMIYGWAMDPMNPATKIRVYFYMDGPAGTGTLIGDTLANMVDLGPYGSSYFAFQIPAAMINNRQHTLYAYLGTVAVANLSPGSPLAYAAYKRSVAGNNYFASNIQPTLTASCQECHTFTIESAFANVTSPTPADGGNATNNNFITNARGSGHPFNGCPGGINSGLCSSIQQWWQIEFGQ